MVYDVVKDYERSMRYFDEVLALRLDHIEALYGKGSILVKSDKNEEAGVFCGSRLQNCGSAGLLDQAIACFDKVLALNDSHAGAWCDRGQALYKPGKCAEAVGCFDKVLSLNGDHAKAIELREACVFYGSRLQNHRNA